MLPLSLTVGEVRDLGPQYTTTNSLAPIRDASVDIVSQSHRAHVPIKELEASVQVAKPAADKSVNSWEEEAGQGKEMVKKRMTINQLFPSTRPAAQPQHPQSRDQTPPPPIGHIRKGSVLPNNHPGFQVMPPRESLLGYLARSGSESRPVVLDPLPSSGPMWHPIPSLRWVGGPLSDLVMGIYWCLPT